ncbi:MAG: 3-deoxy-D-manno-octulosonic acid transferase, partial [Variovorax sp.]
MLRALYSLALVLAQPLLRRKLRRRGQQEPGYLQAVPERFGHYTQAHSSGAVWIHAVSLGETRAAGILLARLREAVPGLRLLLTHGTATGRAEGARLLREGDVQVWQPWDTPGAVARFLDHFQPRIGLLMETEVWPNLTAACQARGVPLALVNARLSEKSLAQATRLSPLSRPAYAALAAVWAQTEADAQRLRQAGAAVQGVFGNLKFDATPDAAQLEHGRRWRASAARPVV